ncbi:MAG: NAD(P)-dependent glycerol-3-phosphate dehydrogenase [Deltaproteobacteria bacterium]|nr:NAD(P)-dependent glycerol-3-phosphate dehydrogenase [Deltaproteobacteria bacterium]
MGILGAGSWGTALAHLAGTAGHQVTLWAYEPEVVASINATRRNPLYLPDSVLPTSVRATADLEELARDQALLLCVVPAQLLRGYLGALAPRLDTTTPLVICSKGIERKTLATLDQVFDAALGDAHRRQIAVLSGPSFAAEVAAGMPTNVTLAARDPSVARRVQTTLATRAFRVYTTDDVVGVEIGGALKNVIAIAIGAADGLGFGHNTRAGIITRGLAEITRLALSMGAKPETMLGLAGVGDLILTCTSDLSRNRQVGKLLAEGRSAPEIQRQMRMVAEGVPTAESAHQLAIARGVELPITEQVFRVLYEGQSVPAAMAALQDRALKDEWQA